MAGKARPSRITPDVLERESEVLRLRRIGLTFDLIAKQLNYSHASGAHKAYVNACNRIVRSDVNDLRDVETDRLDIAQSAVWAGVLRGDVPSVTALIRIMERRARLLGLDMPTKSQIEVTNTDGNTIDSEVARLVALLDSGKTSALDAQPSEK
jgi:hypothetical protein